MTSNLTYPVPQWNNQTTEESSTRFHGNRRGDNKDSRWLTLEVCVDHLNGGCHKKEDDCMKAHVPIASSSSSPLSSSSSSSQSSSLSNELSSDRRVMCCYDFIKGKCYRKDPPCKFFHPPSHLREVLLQNGRQNLLLKNQRSHQQFNALPFMPNPLLPMVYNPTILNPMMTPKMTDGSQIQFLSNHCVVNQGGVAYFYPFMVGTDGWVTIPTNGIQSCQVVPSPPLPHNGSLKQVDHQSIFHMGGFDDVISSPWLHNGYSVPQPAVCGPLCYGYNQGFMKRPPTYDINKVQ